MSKLEVVEGYRCSDGAVFIDINDANKYQAEIDFDADYDNDENGLYAFEQGTVESRQVKDWLVDNKDLVQESYKAMEGK